MTNQVDFSFGGEIEDFGRACDEDLVSNSRQFFPRNCLQPVAAF